MKDSVMNWRKLQARKTYLGLTVAQIAQAAGVCEKTVTLFINGKDAVRPEIQDAIAAALGMRRIIDFETIEADRGFADVVFDSSGGKQEAAAPEPSAASTQPPERRGIGKGQGLNDLGPAL